MHGEDARQPQDATAAKGSLGLAICVLGAFRVRVDGREIPLPGGMLRRLLLCLLAARRPADIGQLAERLAGDGRDPMAPGTVHVHISRLRHLLDPEGQRGLAWLKRTPDGYLLQPDWLDLTVMQEDLDRAEALASTNPREAAALVHATVDRFGPPIEDSLSAWSAVVHDVIARRHAAEDLWAALVVGGATGSPHADDILALARAEPTRENRWSLALRALAREGRQAEALATYREARTLLLDEVGVEPGQELRHTHQAVLRQASGTIVGATVATTPVPTSPTRFVGRHETVALLDRLAVRERLITVHGIGGAGKTRTVAEWLSQTRRDGGACWITLQGVPPGSVARRIALALGVAGADHGPMASLEAVLFGLSSAPSILVLDNADDVIDEVAAVATSIVAYLPQVLVVVTARSPLGVSAERCLALGPLAPGSVEAIELAADRLGVDGTPEQAADLARRAGGLPLAIELLAGQDAHATADLTDLGGIVAGAVGDLSGAGRTLLEALAGLADGASTPLVEHLAADLTPGRRRAVLRELAESSLVVSESGCGPHSGSTVRHRVLQPVLDVRAAWLPSPDPAPYAALADWIEGLLPADYGLVPDWPRLLTIGAERVNLQGAAAEWRDHAPARGVEVLNRTGYLHSWLGIRPAAGEWIRGCLSALGLTPGAEDPGQATVLDPVVHAQALMQLAGGSGLSGIVRHFPLLVQAIARLPADGPAGLWAGCIGLRGLCHGWRGDVAAAERDFAAARERIAHHGDRYVWVATQLDQGEAMLWAPRGQPARAIEPLVAASAAHAALGDRLHAAFAMHYCANLARVGGDPRLTEIIERGVKEARASGSPSAMALLAGEDARAALAAAATADDRLDPGLMARVQRALVAIERIGNTRAAAMIRRDLGIHLLRLGDRSRAEGELSLAAAILLGQDPGSAALAVGGLATLAVPADAARLASIAWALAVSGGTPLSVADRQRLVGWVGPPPDKPPSTPLDAVADQAAAILGLPVLSRSQPAA